MKANRADNISYAIGWLCGAVFVAAPVVAVVYLLRHRRRPAFQAGMICGLSLPVIVGARALMLKAGVQPKQFEWKGVNLLLFVVVPLLATGIVSAISWPRTKGPGSGGRRPSRKAPQPAQST